MHDPTTSDYVGGTIAFIASLVGLLFLLGFAGMMTVGALSSRQLVTSWAPEQEQAFVPFERNLQASHSKAWMFSLISGAVVAIFVVGVYFGVTPEAHNKEMTDSMNMSNLAKKKKVAAPADEKPAEKAPAPAEKAPADPAPEAPPATK